MYDMASVCCVAKPEFLVTHNSIFEGCVKVVLIPAARAIDIDTF